MSTFNNDLLDEICNTLTNDDTLSAYVKSVKKGEIRTAKLLFPFISVSGLRYELNARTTSKDNYTYTVELLAGIRSLVPGAAFEGSQKTGSKGILQLCNDIVSVIRTSDFGGLFSRPIDNIRYKTFEGKGSAGTVWIAVVSFTGTRMVSRV